jgi:ABC-type transport system involved in cytochrome c biogenesis permease subunit
MTADTLLFGSALLAYFIAAVLYQAHVFLENKPVERLPWSIALFGLAIHTVAIVYRGLETGRCPITTRNDLMSLAAWTLVAVVAAIELRPRFGALGALGLPAAFVLVFVAYVLPMEATGAAPFLNSRLLSPHVAATLLGFVAFAVAFTLAVLYLLHGRLLKAKHLPRVTRALPPLDATSRAAHAAAAAGFSMLTLGLITGVIWAMSDWHPGWYLDPKVVASFVAWAIYGAYLYLSTWGGWRGRRPAWFLITGFVAILIAYFGVNHILPGRHPM